VNNAVAKHQPIGANHLSDGQCRGHLHRWDACLFQFRRNRSAAASAGTSRGGEYDGIDAQTLGLLCHLPPHPPRIGERIG